MSHYMLRDYSHTSARASGEILSSRTRTIRLYTLAAIALVWGGLLIARLFSLQIGAGDRWQEWAVKQHSAEMQLASERGPILDRNNKLIAISVPAQSIYVRPGQVKDKKETATQLATLLDLDVAQVSAKLSEKKPFVWIQRQVSRATGEQVLATKLPGVGALPESKRVYPFNESGSALIGKVGIDGTGLSGIEGLFERELHGEHVKTKASKDAFGNLIQVSDSGDFSLPKGRPLKLTIDTSLQQIVDEELTHGKNAAKAKAAIAVLMDSETGEILAMGQSPSTNFNGGNNSSGSRDAMKNLTVETVFEPGSIMKPIVAAAAIEERVVSSREFINCENGRYPFSTHVIKDVHPSKVISFFDVVVRSSNIGMTKVGVRLGSDKLHRYLKAFGFGSTSGLKLPGESAGILRSVTNWAPVDVATHSFGQGVAVTPLQMVRALGVLANGGRLPELKVVDDGMVTPPVRVISSKTAEQVQEMMFGVVEDEDGTGSNARIEGVRIGGKTGTAQKARTDGKGYAQGAYVASFAGFADARALGVDHNLVLVVIVDEPRGGSIYGGAVAAPIFQKIMERSLHVVATRNELNMRRDSTKPKVYEAYRRGDSPFSGEQKQAGFSQVAYYR
jgi:cell division protein FtsI (penicillin-binding protein 3)